MNKRIFAGQNLADAFNNMGLTPWLEMEIETAGIFASSNGIEY